MVTDQGLVHYEAYGRGKPVILLHCWLGSWSYWLSTMESLSKTYKTYALDFWGFGESAKSSNLYNVPDYVQMVTQFMERLGIELHDKGGNSVTREWLGDAASTLAALVYTAWLDADRPPLAPGTAAEAETTGPELQWKSFLPTAIVLVIVVWILLARRRTPPGPT